MDAMLTQHNMYLPGYVRIFLLLEEISTEEK